MIQVKRSFKLLKRIPENIQIGPTGDRLSSLHESFVNS
jgi:hypothetical protein